MAHATDCVGAEVSWERLTSREYDDAAFSRLVSRSHML